LDELNNLGVSVVALSTDPLEKAQETVTTGHLTFPVGYGLSVPEDADRIGAAWEEERGIIQPSEFLLGNKGTVLHTTYSSGPIGRIKACDLARLVTFLERKRQRST
jgi:peroxiredoxin